MITAGIIAEYNPFHEGHRYHIAQTKKQADAVIVAMSGAFMQRGEPALFPARIRARAAVLNGADLVLQLPVFSSLQGGAQFAEGGVSLLGRTHTASILSFGTESDKTDFFFLIKDFLKNETDFYIDLLHKSLRQGFSYAAAREKALAAFFGPETAARLKQPNNILALEYLLALEKLHLNMKPCFIKRTGAGHDTLQADQTPSALHLRKAFYAGGWERISPLLPDSALYEGAPFVLPDAFEKEVLYLLRTKKEAPTAPDMHEDLWRLLTQAALRHTTLAQIIPAAEARQFNHARIKRALLQMLLDIRREDAEKYRLARRIRVLAFNDTGRELLKTMQKDADFQPVTNIDRAVQEDMSLSLDLKADMLWCAAAGLSPLSPWQEGPAYIPGRHKN